MDPGAYQRDLRKMTLGEGEEVEIRIMRKEDAYTYGAIKHYWGYIIRPLSEWNGNFPTEWHLMLKAMFLPEGKTSIAELSADELRTYKEQCEVYAHTAHPEAFTLYR